ncbi:MAG: ABC transporter substrate-binding protein, partial [Ilumatobacter coccineus]
MRKSLWTKAAIGIAVVGLVGAACSSSSDDTKSSDAGSGDGAAAEFTLFGAPTGVEGEALDGFLNVYNTETGSKVAFTGSDQFEDQLRIRVEGGDPPAVAFTPQPGSICTFKDSLVSLEDMGFDIAEMETNHSKFWMDLGVCDDGQHYGIPWFPNFKSIVFYHKPTFEAQGYAVPETYADMVALSEQAVADGFTPWCMGFESDAATGWPGTDWIEDIYVRQSGGDMYAKWFKHEIPFNDPSVVAAFDKYGEIMFGEGFVLGGANNVGSVNFGDSPGPLFQDPQPGCLMLKQGSFISNFFVDQPDYEEGEEAE